MIVTSTFLYFLSLSISTAYVNGHAQMIQPPSRNSRDPNSGLGSVQKPCGDYPKGAPVATYTAGQSVNVKLQGSATHSGGGCVFSLSYDEGKTFSMIHVTDKECPKVQDFNVKIPESAPACDSCIFAWSWVPIQSGAPEYFMGCADIRIVNDKVPAGNGYKGPSLPFFNMAGAETFWTNNGDKSATLPWVENVPALQQYLSGAPSPLRAPQVSAPESVPDSAPAPVIQEDVATTITESECRSIGFKMLLSRDTLQVRNFLRLFFAMLRFCERFDN